MKIQRFILVLMAASLASCSFFKGDNKLACNSPETQEALRKSFIESSSGVLLSEASKLNLSADTSGIVSLLNQFKTSIEDVTTISKSDDKKQITCKGTMVIQAPSAMISQVTEAMNAHNKSNNILALAQASGLSSNKPSIFKRDVDYSVRATDDKQVNKVDVESISEVAVFPARVVIISQYPPSLNTIFSSSAITANTPIITPLQDLTATTEGLPVKKNEAVDQPKPTATPIETWTGTYKKADSGLNSAWKSLPDPLRTELKQEQADWVAVKESECKEMSAASTGADDAKVAHVKCLATKTQARTSYISKRLKSYKAAELKKLESVKGESNSEAPKETVPATPAAPAKPEVPAT